MNQLPLRELYLHTLRDTLCGASFQDSNHLPYWPLRRLVKKLLPGLIVSIPSKSENKSDKWPIHALTMVGKKRLNNFRAVIEAVHFNSVQGAIVECGVWRGGSSIFAAGVLQSLGDTRNIHLCDSFTGVPAGILDEDLSDNLYRSADVLGISQKEVKENFKRFHLWSSNIWCWEGLFKDTLPKFPEGKIAVLRCDGDLYESTMDILVNLYPKVVVGGYVIIDDWSLPMCKKACEDYFWQYQIKPKLVDIEGNNPQGNQIAVFWRKEA